MTVLYFTSPLLEKRVKLEVDETSTGVSLMDVVENKNIDIPYECESALCGLCLIKVTHPNGEPLDNMALTDREIEALEYLDKLPEQHAKIGLINGVPSAYRLACQTTVTHQDLLIEFPIQA